MPHTETSSAFHAQLHAADHRIIGWNSLNLTEQRVLADGADARVQAFRVRGLCDDSRPIRAPRNPLTRVTGQLFNGKLGTVRELFGRLSRYVSSSGCMNFVPGANRL